MAQESSVARAHPFGVAMILVSTSKRNPVSVFSDWARLVDPTYPKIARLVSTMCSSNSIRLTVSGVAAQGVLGK